MNQPLSPMTRSEEDHALAEKARDGSREAFGALVIRHHATVRTLLWRIIGRGDEVDDLAQEVFMSALRNIEKIRLDSSFRTWLLSIARNAAITHLRRRRTDRLTLVDRIEQLVDHKHEQALLDDQFPAIELDALKMCIDRLEPPHRELIVQAYFKGRSPSELSKQLGTPAGTIRMRLMRIRRALSNCIRNRQIVT